MAESTSTRLARSLRVRKHMNTGGAEAGSNTAYVATDLDCDGTQRTTDEGDYHWDSNPADDRTSGYGHTNGTPHD